MATNANARKKRAGRTNLDLTSLYVAELDLGYFAKLKLITEKSGESIDIPDPYGRGIKVS